MDKKYISCLINDKVGVCAISLVLDKRHVRNGGKYPIALRFTIDRKRLYYPLGDKYTEKEFDAICRAKNTGRRSNIKSEKETNFECKILLEQTFKSYVDIVQDLDKTSKLSLNMIMTRLTGKNEEDSFLLVWEDIINNRSVGTADSYTTAKKSFIKYVGVISGFNVSKGTIEKWIKGMENDGFTKTTIGIYLRACRVVWNECTQRGFLSKKEYPFGKDKSLITIPVGSTRKKEYLNVEQMTELYQVFINKKYPESWQKSYIEKVHFSLGLFLVQYLCNGFNLADAARLRYNDYYYISGKQSFQFMRYKTKDRSENNSEVVIPIIEPLRIILSEIAAPEERGGLVFPSILKGETRIGLWLFQVIGLELDDVQEICEDIYDQMFISRATWSLPYWEKAYGITPLSDQTIEQRRQQIKQRREKKALNPARFEKILSSLSGVEAKIVENTGKNTFQVIFYGTVNNYDEVLRRIEQLKPAHLICDVHVSEVSESETNINYVIVSSSCEYSSVIISEV